MRRQSNSVKNCVYSVRLVYKKTITIENLFCRDVVVTNEEEKRRYIYAVATLSISKCWRNIVRNLSNKILQIKVHNVEVLSGLFNYVPANFYFLIKINTMNCACKTAAHPPPPLPRRTPLHYASSVFSNLILNFS